MSHTLSTSGLSDTGIYGNLEAQAYMVDDDSFIGEPYEVAQETLCNVVNISDFKIPKAVIHTPVENDPLYMLFKVALNDLKAASPDVQAAVKQLVKKQMQGINPQLPLDISQYRVKTKIEEGDFNALYGDIKNLDLNTKNLIEKVFVRIKLIAGDTPSLIPNDPNYAKKKEEASHRFNSYETLYNNAVDILLKMTEEEESIDKLQKRTNETIDQFIHENNSRIDHFKAQFDILYSEHGFVNERIQTGYESTKSRWIGVSASVILPEHKALPKDPLTQSKIDLSDDFSPLFKEINEYYGTLKNFGDRVQAHLNTVSGTRKAWNDKNPDFTDFKDSANYLPKTYKPLADECNKVYETLFQHNEKLEDLKSVLTRRLSDKFTQILDSKNLLIDAFKTYVNESKKLDLTIHGSLTVCKDIRVLVAATKEKYPTKEKEDQKEMKETSSL